jgi:hypothetical protein
MLLSDVITAMGWEMTMSDDLFLFSWDIEGTGSQSGPPEGEIKGGIVPQA